MCDVVGDVCGVCDVLSLVSDVGEYVNMFLNDLGVIVRGMG